ncbi:low molecular weight protein tyrosine phosphatase family protein [Lewinella sp. 4G2]|uniref:low molecular weight protein tyrosine phosphatase family protein n=1 Tax=Lewinella sp. 4G2 TaxID=1803372 RepID=UPI0007B4DFED|nr:protein tyrosine phosphatase [Lewinella sp. 4G2]OAV43411.1 protein tyrosine phosphatase [Lewinella sp. 4G2]
MNLLFLCSRNQWRSRTAETIFKNNGLHQVKSAGTSAAARVRVNASLLRWADRILVMEDRHREIIEERFPDAVRGKEVEVLDIPDDYRYMNEELVAELRLVMEGIID